MSAQVQIKTALISVFSKNRIDLIARLLNNLNINILSTGGTYDFIRNLGIDVTAIDTITSYPSILGGRVKTLHPKIFGGILYRRDMDVDRKEIKQYEIPPIDLVIVDLYPFENTVEQTNDDDEIIEKIDIGGISLIRASAKNFKDVLIVPSADQYDQLIALLTLKSGSSDIEDRKYFATQAFNVSSHYDTRIFEYFNKDQKIKTFKRSIPKPNPLRYGENPHQQGLFYGDLNKVFEQLHGKAVSYNNLVDIDAAINLIREFSDPTFVVIKHTNACGIATRTNPKDAWNDALACDPISAFGGVITTNRPVDIDTAKELNKLFFEILIAEEYDQEALELLKSRKNRILLKKKAFDVLPMQFKSVLNGVIEQEKDLKTEEETDFHPVTKAVPSALEIQDLIFANKIVKHQKSNTIVLVKGKQLIGSGVGQTSRVDALKQALVKAQEFGFGLKGAVMASDAFFPFADCVEIAHQAGINAVVQPGGSVRDSDSISYCDANGMSMVFTGIRHFKH
ncbi:MAG: bifunctional phosphoribosylaminoimidazolecarboxamide formyltransferase/IMP cyclohydrolase [Bacteroidetes bacterium]|nr:bifunctional phosphoribosylaminoimidazolecarboxamide formyltransferase/IMP cyclohydrolase [Bacteroidota bacterium]